VRDSYLGEDVSFLDLANRLGGLIVREFTADDLNTPDLTRKGSAGIARFSLFVF
jgi:hypothetical protein